MTATSLFSRVSTALAGLTGWYASRHGYEDFASVPDGAELSHQSYSIALLATVPLAGRQRLSASEAGTLHRTDLRVRWLYRVRVEQRDTDYAAALAAEDTLRAAVLATRQSPALRISLGGDGAERRELPSSTGPMLLGELAFNVVHAIPLA